MELISWLLIGLVAGVAAMFVVYRTLPRKSETLIVALVVGLVGGWLGGWIGDRINVTAAGTIGSLVIAFLGAWLLLWFMRLALPSPPSS